MAKRALSVSKQADELLTLIVAAGSIPGIRPSRFISSLSEDVYNVVFHHLPDGKLAENPAYKGIDPDFDGYSRYEFSHGLIGGTYASSPDHVILLELYLVGKVPIELTGVQRREDVA